MFFNKFLAKEVFLNKTSRFSSSLTGTGFKQNYSSYKNWLPRFLVYVERLDAINVLELSSLVN